MSTSEEPTTTYIFIKRIRLAVFAADETYAELELREGDTVALLAARAGGGMHLHLVGANGTDLPTAAAEAAALASPPLPAGWPLSRAGIAAGAWLLAQLPPPGGPSEPACAFDFPPGTAIPGQTLTLGPHLPSAPARRPQKAALFLAAPAHITKVIPLLHCPTADNEIELQRLAAALGLAPNIIAATYSPSFAWVTMERMEGGTIFDALGEEAYLLGEAGGVLAAAVRATLRALASANIFYPDSTPFNFMVEPGEGPPRVWVIDFEHAELLGDGDARLAAQGDAEEPLWNSDFF